MPKVMIAPAPLATLRGAFLDTLAAERFELLYPLKQVQMTEADLITQMPGVTYSLAGSEPYTRRVLSELPELKVIARAGVGWDGVDVDAATELGVVVTFAPGTNHDAVAEHTFTLILALAKKLVSQHNKILAGQWPRAANLPLRGQTLAVIGLGRAGRAVAKMGAAFGMTVVAHEPTPLAAPGVPLLSLDDALAAGDFVSLHMPLVPGTRRMINARTLALMKPTAFLINTARGGVVDEPALVDALANGRLAGAGLDVFDEEPPPADHPLFKLDNVVCTAHTAGVDLRSRDDMAARAAEAIARLHRGDWPAEWVVNPEVRDRRR